MSWTEDRSRGRIARLLSTVPEAGIRVEEFATSYRQRREFEARMRGALPSTATIDALPYHAVVVTDGVHVYANLLDYDTYLEDLGRETEVGCMRVLEFLHLHYSGMDRLIEAYGAQRVDHHGGRVHAVVLEPTGAEKEGERIRIALSLAASMRALVGEASAAHQRKFGSRIRVGVESGGALAINSGRKGEPEPLFIGDAANQAAKLADGDIEGVALGARARQVLAVSEPLTLSVTGMVLDEAAFLPTSGERALLASYGRKSRVDEAREQFRVRELADAGHSAGFGFFRHDLPLAGLDFAALSPSRSVRQEMVSVFADLSGFTAYVHAGMASGNVKQVVSNLHVLRGEMAAVLRDFGGRKVRFIGDCIQGAVAEGTRARTHEMDTIRQAVKCAGALRSSFELCQRLLPGIQQLGLTIGIEFGTTPITRLGIRGVRSVRCSSSRAVTVSERVQRNCENNQTALGENALAKAPSAIRQAFGGRGVIHGLDYEVAIAFAAAMSAPAIARAAVVPAEPHAA
nr:adenylate/guanylate cyclase domain-containing protein [uncultured Sphingomonas sp.]